MFNPIEASKNIKDEFISYITTSFSLADADLRQQLKEELNIKIANGPWLEINDIFKTGKSIRECIAEGILSPLFVQLEADKPNTKLYTKMLPLDRPLYTHQEKAIQSIVAGNNTIISTGTGSGKTNCFLIPVLNALLREKERGKLCAGIRALFIYPMNALANDQIKNLRKILMYYPDITFGVYNGGTEQNEEKAIALYNAMFANENIPKLKKRLPNELLSRAEMKKNPPNILFTNYAMLEHLLFRPQDDVLFSDADFKFVVLDEAHVYAGATGIETAMLLSRLRARISASKKTQFILTSATLGHDESVDDNIIKFAKNLCGVEFFKNNIIRAERVKYEPPAIQREYPDSLIIELANEQNKVSEILKKYEIKCDPNKSENELLYDFVNESVLYNKLRSNLKKISTVYEIQDALQINADTAAAFISLCTRAQKDGKALIDARYHFFVRCLEGCYITLNNKLFLTRQKMHNDNNVNYAVFEIAVCDDCGKFALVGNIEEKKLVQVGKLDETVDYFYLAEDINNDIELEQEDEKKRALEYYYLCPHCAAIVPEYQLKNPPCDCGTHNYRKVVKAKLLKIGARCGNCHSGSYMRLYLGNDGATSVLATALYEELPESTYEEFEDTNIKTTNIFAKAALTAKKKEIRKGRQFLAFSDSRQEAAKFACYLSKSYNEFLRRRGICRIIQENTNLIIEDKFTIDNFVQKLKIYFSNKKTFAESNRDMNGLTVESNRQAWIAMLKELVRSNATTSLTYLGILQFSYKGIMPEIVQEVANRYNVAEDIAYNLLHLLTFEIVKAGAICTNDDTDIDDAAREYIYFSSHQKFIAKERMENNAIVTAWMPKTKINGKEGYYRTQKLYYVKKFLNIDDEEACNFLENWFDYLVDTENNPYCMEDKNKDGTYVMPAKNFLVKIAQDSSAYWYKCKKCGKVSPYHMHGKCIAIRCENPVEKIPAMQLHAENHFAKLYFNDRMAPLFIKEHTAQLSRTESADYQEKFIKKELNALSCSTTFEMGVDVGDLEAVFLRDMPPLPSNYAQRAGRAGRSIHAAAYALTYAKLSSHDLSFFKEPDSMINGSILPPLFKVDNEKIAKRHIYAVAFSMFFAQKPELYNRNNAEKFINQKGYKEFIDWLEGRPESLKQMLLQSIPNIENLHTRLGIISFEWLDAFIGETGVLTSLLQTYEANIQTFEELIQKAKDVDDFGRANSYQNKLNIYKNNKLIDFLARGNILPRYGFPVDTVELEQNTTAENLHKLQLSRDLSIAIAEYAPSSEVIADGKMYISRYIKKSLIEEGRYAWHIANIAECTNTNCKCMNYSITPISQEGTKCVSCGQQLFDTDFYESIEPRAGFVTEKKAKDVPLTRQEKNYRSDAFYIGNRESKTIDKFHFKINNILVKMESTMNDSLMMKSTNTFFVCPKCGFAFALDENIPNDNEANKFKYSSHKITTKGKHDSLFDGRKCDCQELKRFSLHHTFNTDVIKLSFDCDTSNYYTMASTMYALLYAISKDLNIERRDIKACLSMKIENSKPIHSIIIYDAVTGGAGHARRLVTEDGKVLYNIIQSAFKNMETCTCEPSCYNCLRSYENQNIHENLNRKLAMDFLAQFKGSLEKVN